MSTTHAGGVADARALANTSNLTPAAYTIRDACQLLSISRSHLYQMTASGRLRMIKLGTSSRIPASEIDRILAGGTP